MVNDAVEKKCPLCGAPRPPRAKRCMCNYTFEYERPSRPSIRAQRPRSTMQFSNMIGIAVLAAAMVLGYFRLQPPKGSHDNVALLLVPIGLFAVAGAHFNWSFFMRNSKARRVSFFLGHTGARYFYALLGGALVGAGLGLLIA